MLATASGASGHAHLWQRERAPQRMQESPPLEEALPLVLATSVSLGERRALERAFRSAGFDVRTVACADDASNEISNHDGSCVLVIDSGLLEMSDDAQWRLLRAHNPGLGLVIRCWIQREPGVERTEARTFLVHPDHAEGLFEAVRSLGASASVA